MSMNNSSSVGGEQPPQPVTSRYTNPVGGTGPSSAATATHGIPDRRRRKNVGGNYDNNVPRYNNRMNSGGYNHRDGGRMSHSHRGGGGGGDGLHNGSGYRGGNDYDSQHHSQSTMTSNEGQMRRDQSQQHHYYPYQPHQQQYSHHSHHGKSTDYDSRQRNSSNAGGGYQHHQSENHHRSNYTVAHNSNLAEQYGTGVGGGGTHPMVSGGEIVHHQDAYLHSTNTGGHQVAHFPGAPQQIPGPAALSFFSYQPSMQPAFGTIAICHIPYGLNPQNVISPAVHTQIIGSTVMAPTPGMPYTYPYALPVPSPLVQSQPVLIQQAAQPVPQHQHYQNQPQYHEPAAVGIHHSQQGQGNNEDEQCNPCLMFNEDADASSILNPDADVFFPPPREIDFDEADEEGSTGHPETSEIKSEENDSLRVDDTDIDVDTKEDNHVQKEEDKLDDN